MTVPHVDRSARPGWFAAAAAVAVAAFFLAQYVLADHLAVIAGKVAAVAGLSAEVVVWSVVMLVRAPRGRPSRAPAQVGAALGVLVPPVILGWTVFDLLRDGLAFGSWASIPPMALLPAVVLVLARPAADQPVAEQPAVERPEEEPPVDDQPAEQQPAEQAEPDAVRPATLGVGVDSAFWSGVTSTLSPNDQEQGGVALTTTVDGMPVVIGVVLPAQISATPVWCEFAVADVERVRQALDAVDPRIQERIGLSWLHTHPGLGVFLSGTDVATSAKWRGLDPGFRPIVVDVSKPTLDKQIGVFGADDRPIAPIGLVSDTVDLETARALQQAVFDRYRSEGAPEPTVLIGALRRRTGPQRTVGSRSHG